MGKQPSISALLLVGLVPAIAGGAETVVLRNGYRLQAESHEIEGERVRLRMANGGWIGLSAGQIAEIAPDTRQSSSRPPRTTPVPRASADPRKSRNPADDLTQAIDRVSGETGVPAELVRAVIWAESGFRQDAVSAKGAVGMMQLMPDTATELGVDPTDMTGNLRGGTRYLRQLLERYSGGSGQLVKALAAYNAGPGQVERFGGVPPFPETEAYVAKVLRRFLASETDSGPR
ncbi:MAG: lytic transglycosylase domain-containing protein [Bryobacterales bacterium]|nr:lytic transglycosylase domain-containing protein [Bryobacterales bacterium]